MTSAQPDREALLRHVARRLSQFGGLDEPDVDAVVRLKDDVAMHARGADITAAQGKAPRIVVAGWACHVRPHAGRPRQIFGFLLPGEVIGSFWRQPDYTFHRTVALTRLELASAQTLVALGADGVFHHPVLMDAARRAEDHSHHLILNHITRLGARDAYAGLAHLLIELHDRLERVGLAHGGEFRLPVGQRVLAQAMGFSLAHTNHTLQRMAEDGLFEARDEVVRLLQPEKMAALADFQVDDPADAVARGSTMNDGAHRRAAASTLGDYATMDLIES